MHRSVKSSLAAYVSAGATQQVNQVYSAYYKLLMTFLVKAWEPSKETLQDLQERKPIPTPIASQPG